MVYSTNTVFLIGIQQIYRGFSKQFFSFSDSRQWEMPLMSSVCGGITLSLYHCSWCVYTLYHCQVSPQKMLKALRNYETLQTEYSEQILLVIYLERICYGCAVIVVCNWHFSWLL